MNSRRTHRGPRFVLCLANPRHPASLDVRKVYRVRTDAKAQSLKLLRVVDESGDDYLFPAKWFVPIAIPRRAAKLFGTSR
jgi:hypothetical protein